MSQQTPTGYAPLGGITTSANVATRALLSALSMPNPIDGMTVFCSEAGVRAPFVFSLDSGAAIDGVNVLATSVGGNSRWLKISVGMPTSVIPTPVAAAIVTAAAAYDNSFGFAAGIVHGVAGKYTLTLSSPLAINKRIILPVPVFTTLDTSRSCTVDDIDASSFVVQTWNNSAPVLQDSKFTVAVFSIP